MPHIPRPLVGKASGHILYICTCGRYCAAVPHSESLKVRSSKENDNANSNAFSICPVRARRLGRMYHERCKVISFLSESQLRYPKVAEKVILKPLNIVYVACKEEKVALWLFRAQCLWDCLRCGLFAVSQCNLSLAIMAE